MLDAIAIADRGRPRSSLSEPEPRCTARRPPGGSLILSARAPHTILAASSALCALIGYSAAEITQRSVRLLYGPATDPAAIPSAVKRLLEHEEACAPVSAPALIVYDRAGEAHAVTAVCTRAAASRGVGCGGGGGAGVSACRLRLEWPPNTRGPPALPACLWSLD